MSKNRKTQAKNRGCATRVNGIPIRHLGPERFMVDARAIISESVESAAERVRGAVRQTTVC